MNSSSLQIVLIATPNDNLVGTITDGDIRRGLLSGLNLKSSCETIVRRTPLVVPPEMSREAVLQLMQANRILQLPIVNQEGRLVGLHVWNEVMMPQMRPNLMVIMAGGQGTRLRPFTDNCPKPLLPVAGKAILEHIIERARDDGFRNFVIAIHYLGHMIEEYFGDGSQWQVHIDYLREEKPLGTAGALSLLTQYPKAAILVSNADVLTDIHYSELLDFHVRQGPVATMAVRSHEWQHPFGVVNTRGVDIVSFEEKPITRTHINAGIYVLEPQALECLVVGEPCDMPVLFTRLLARGQRAIVYPIHEPWLDVGQHADFAHAQVIAEQNVPRNHIGENPNE